MFLLLGLCTTMLGIATFLVLPEDPMSASWMSKIEKVALLRHVAENKTGVRNAHIKPSQVFEVLLDPQVYLLFFMEVAVSLLH